MNVNLIIALEKTPEKTTTIDDKSMNRLVFESYKFNPQKSTNNQLVFTATSKLIDYYLYGVIYIIFTILLVMFFEKFGFHGKFSSIVAQTVMISALAIFVGLIIIPFTMIKNIIFVNSNNNLFIEEELLFGRKNEILNFEKVKKVITKVDTKNNYITFRNGNVLPQSIIIKIGNENPSLIKETIDFLLKFTENKYPDIEFTQI